MGQLVTECISNLDLRLTYYIHRHSPTEETKLSTLRFDENKSEECEKNMTKKLNLLKCEDLTIKAVKWVALQLTLH